MTKNVPYFTTLCWSLLHKNSKPPSLDSTHLHSSHFSNIVGYQEITIPGNAGGTGYSLFTVTFKNVGGEGLPINKIEVLNSEGGAIASSVNKIQLQKISGSHCVVDNSTTYQYTTGRGIGWHVLGAATTKLPDNIVLSDGEGVLVSNGQGADVKFRVSGEVDIAPMSFPIPYTAGGTGYSIFGNSTPVAIQINQIKVLDSTKAVIGTSVNKIQIQKIQGEHCVVDNATTYQYTTGRGIGWHALGAATTKLSDDVKLAPGEAVLVSNGQGDTVYLQLPAPIQ